MTITLLISMLESRSFVYAYHEHLKIQELCLFLSERRKQEVTRKRRACNGLVVLHDSSIKSVSLHAEIVFLAS